MPESCWEDAHKVAAHRCGVPDRELKYRDSFVTDREHIGGTNSVFLNAVASA